MTAMTPLSRVCAEDVIFCLYLCTEGPQVLLYSNVIAGEGIPTVAYILCSYGSGLTLYVLNKYI